MRRIRFKGPESGKTLIFHTNNTALPALIIAAPYGMLLGVKSDSGGPPVIFTSHRQPVAEFQNPSEADD